MSIFYFSCIDNKNDNIIVGIVYEKQLTNNWNPVVQRYITNKKVNLLIGSKMTGFIISNYIYDNYNEDDSIYFSDNNFIKMILPTKNE